MKVLEFSVILVSLVLQVDAWNVVTIMIARTVSSDHDLPYLKGIYH